jgi:quercetin dioxygenase-like cupin family protein
MSYFIDLTDLNPKAVGPGMQIRVASGERIMLSYVDLQEGAEVKDHTHIHEQAGIVIEGEGDFRIGEERRRVRPGDLYIIPSQVVHRLLVVKGPMKVLDIFSPPREEYR